MRNAWRSRGRLRGEPPALRRSSSGECWEYFGAAVIIFWMRTISAARQSACLQAAPPGDSRVGFAFLAMAVHLVDNPRLADQSAGGCGWCAASACWRCAVLSDACVRQVRAVSAVRPGIHPRRFAAGLPDCIDDRSHAQTSGAWRSLDFSGRGNGKQMARIFAPILLLLPFAWEGI